MRVCVFQVSQRTDWLVGTTEFPVLSMLTVTQRVCLATGSCEEQTCWANTLQTRHQISGMGGSLIPAPKSDPENILDSSHLSPLCLAFAWCGSALWCENSPGSKAFLDAVLALEKLGGRFQTEAYPVSCEEEVSSYQKRRYFIFWDVCSLFLAELL